MKIDGYALNSQQIKENLEHICSGDRDAGYVSSQVKKYYRSGSPFVWVDMMGVDSRADSLLAILNRQLPAIGFSAKSFRLTEIAQDLERLRTLTFDADNDINRVVARLEYHLSKAYVNYVAGQRFGFVNPLHVLNRFDPRATDSTGHVLTYRQLYDVNIERPDSAYIVRTFRRAMSADSLADCLSHVEPTDTLYTQLLKLLSTAGDDQRQRILVNMERCRWREKLRPEPGAKYVIVNVPAFHLWAVGPDTVMDMRAACGALKTKTPLLSSRITHMEVNPEWVIPMSIIRDDVSRHAGDTSYFSRHRYYIAERKTGRRVPTRTVSAAMLRSGNYRVAQEGGAGNSLGRIIFRFANNFSVFMHDTSSPGVFHRDNRGVSHGCVRVQRPFDLALFMMEKEPDEQLVDKLRISMGLEPETDWGREKLEELEPEVRTPTLVRSIPVSPRVPIFITYYTIFRTPKGELQYSPDVYGYDKCISEALKKFTE